MFVIKKMPSSVKQLLTNYTVDIIPVPKNGIIEINHKDSLISGFEVFISNFYITKIN